jgi:LPS-assembly lipoprotein
MTGRASRRAFLALGSGAALTACGFHPVYMPTASGQAGPAQRELAAIYVNIIGERPGMLLRQALQERFEGTGDAVARRYDLTVSYWMSGEILGVQPDTTVTRVRFVGYANWVLSAQDPAHTHLTDGATRAADALNLIDSQYFAAGLELTTIQNRMAQTVADQITLELAAYFRRHAAGAATG